MSEACEALGIPVIGGNVSFYNESRGSDIDPTPVAGVIGIIDRLTECRRCRARPRASIWCCSDPTAAELGGSEWAAIVHELDGGLPPVADLEAAVRLHAFVRDLVVERTVSGVHDCADGGVAVALAEMAFGSGVGFQLDAGAGTAGGGVVLRRIGDRVVVSVDARPLPTVLAAGRRCGRARRRPRGRRRRPARRRRGIRRGAGRCGARVARSDPGGPRRPGQPDEVGRLQPRDDQRGRGRGIAVSRSGTRTSGAKGSS